MSSPSTEHGAVSVAEIDMDGKYARLKKNFETVGQLGAAVHVPRDISYHIPLLLFPGWWAISLDVIKISFPYRNNFCKCAYLYHYHYLILIYHTDVCQCNQIKSSAVFYT